MPDISRRTSVARGTPPSAAATPEELFAAVRAMDSARPVVTFYDRATGERAELSAASLGNWVAKTHFLLTDELGLGRGETAFVDLPVHWLALPIWFGVFSAGLALTDRPGSASVSFVDADPLAPTTFPLSAELFAVPLLPWGRSFDQPPAGMTDYVAAVRPQADAWASVRRTGLPGDRATDGATRTQLLDAARARGVELGLAHGARVLLSDRAGRRLELLDVLAVLGVGGSLVLVRHAGSATDPGADAGWLATLINQEQVTVAV